MLLGTPVKNGRVVDACTRARCSSYRSPVQEGAAFERNIPGKSTSISNMQNLINPSLAISVHETRLKHDNYPRLISPVDVLLEHCTFILPKSCNRRYNNSSLSSLCLVGYRNGFSRQHIQLLVDSKSIAAGRRDWCWEDLVRTTLNHIRLRMLFRPRPIY